MRKLDKLIMGSIVGLCVGIWVFLLVYKIDANIMQSSIFGISVFGCITLVVYKALDGYDIPIPSVR